MTSCGQRVNVTFWVLNAIICILISERQRVSGDTDNHKRKQFCEDRSEDWSGVASSQETAAPQLAGRVKNRFCESLWGGVPLPHPDSGALASWAVREHLSIALLLPVCENLLQQPQEANTRIQAGYCNKKPQGRQPLQSSSFSQFWRLGVQDRVPANLVFGESWLSVSQMVPLHCVLTWKGLGSSLGLFYKGTNSIHEGPISNPHHLPKAPPLKTITLGVWFHHMNLGAGTSHSKVGSELCSQLKY